MSRVTVYRYAAHMQDMFQLTKSIDALGAHANERNKIIFYNKRHRQAPWPAPTGLSQRPCCRAEAQQQSRGSDMARLWPELGKLAQPRPGLGLVGLQATGLSNLSSRPLQLQALPLPDNSPP